MLARGILGSGQTRGVSFWPFPNSSGWWWLISSVFLIRISCHKTTHANGYYGAWPGWAVSISVLPLTGSVQPNFTERRGKIPSEQYWGYQNKGQEGNDSPSPSMLFLCNKVQTAAFVRMLQSKHSWYGTCGKISRRVQITSDGGSATF